MMKTLNLELETFYYEINSYPSKKIIVRTNKQQQQTKKMPHNTS